MRLLIAATLLLTACSTAYGEEINDREAENILTKGKILHAGEGTAGSHNFTVLFSKKLYWCVHVPHLINCYKTVSNKKTNKFGFSGQ